MDDSNTSQCPPNASQDGTCAFLKLPAELRNRIYELVLFNSSGLHCVKGVPKPIFSACSDHMAQEFNLIKYACKQIYAEAKGIEVSLNMIIFSAPGVKFGAAAQFLFFLRECKVSWLRSVTLMASLPGSAVRTEPFTFPARPLDLVEISYLCRDNPRITVKFIISNFVFVDAETPFNALGFMRMGAYLTRVLRGQDILSLLPYTGPWPRDSVRAIENFHKVVNVKKLLVPNLEFCPLLLDEFCEEVFQESMDFFCGIQPGWDEVRRCVDIAKAWSENGI